MVHSLRSRHLFFCSLLSLTIFLISCQPKANMGSIPPTVHWRSLEDGQQEAAQRNMPVLVDFFYGSECMRCLKVQKDIYDNSEIVDLIEKDFVPVRIWLTNDLTDQEEALSQKLKNNSECILAFLDAKGNVVKNVQGKDISSMGMLPAKDYIQFMNDALKSLKNGN